MPVSEFLARHNSAEITELIALAILKQEPPANQPKVAPTPEQQANLIKQGLFKGRT